jgi:hypothetical protein
MKTSHKKGTGWKSKRHKFNRILQRKVDINRK